MTDQLLKTRMGTRLTALFKAVPETTSEFWDLCCDHGALGRAVLESNLNCPVVFNDIHTGIMASLEARLTQLKARNYRLNLGPAEAVELTASTRPTLMLAGVGAEQCITILQHLFAQSASASATFIISPATKTHSVRQFLIAQSVYLIEERVVTENNRSYEILIIRRTESASAQPMSDNAANRFGACWQVDNPEHQTHLVKLVGYYGAQLQQRNRADTVTIVQGYKNILKNYRTWT